MARILLYGCEVAKGAEGRAFIEAFSRAVGAHVAASATPVGSAALGGDWELAERTGPVAAARIPRQSRAGGLRAHAAGVEHRPLVARWHERLPALGGGGG